MEIAGGAAVWHSNITGGIMPALRTMLSLIALVVAASFVAPCGILSAQAKDEQSGPIAWSTDLKKSLATAKQSNKYVLVDFYTDWCSMCKVMDKTTYKDAGFAKYINAKFLCVKLNAEDKGEGQKEAESHNIGDYPHMLIYNSGGKVIGQLAGFQKPQDYEASLDKVLSKAK